MSRGLLSFLAISLVFNGYHSYYDGWSSEQFELEVFALYMNIVVHQFAKFSILHILVCQFFYTSSYFLSIEHISCINCR